MIYTVAAQLPVGPEQAWAVLADLGGWPTWTPTVEHVTPPVTAPVEGQRVTVKQPGRRGVEYTIDRVEPGRRFRWGRRSGGVHQWADHVVTPDGDGACTMSLTFAMTGPVGGLLGVLGARKIRAMVDTEAASLRARLTTDADVT